MSMLQSLYFHKSFFQVTFLEFKLCAYLLLRVLLLVFSDGLGDQHP